MLSRLIAMIAFASLMTGPFCFAQSKTDSIPPAPDSLKQQRDKQQSGAVVRVSLPPPITIRPIKLPPEKNAWVVQIISRGGLDGSGKGDLIITSQGELTWLATSQCNRKLSTEALQELTEVALSADTSKWGQRKYSYCADCYITAIVLHRREADGVEQIYGAYWDESTKALMPDEVIKVYEKFAERNVCKN